MLQVKGHFLVLIIRVSQYYYVFTVSQVNHLFLHMLKMLFGDIVSVLLISFGRTLGINRIQRCQESKEECGAIEHL